MLANKLRLSLVRVRPSRTLLVDIESAPHGVHGCEDAIRGRLLGGLGLVFELPSRRSGREIAGFKNTTGGFEVRRGYS